MDSRKFLSDSERESLETYLVSRLDSDLRNCALFLTALHSGARANELLSLTWNEIDLVSGEIFLATLKGGRPRPIVVPKLVREALSRLKTMSPEKPFKISYSRLAELWTLYRPAEKPFRSLRHSFAMRAYDRTKNIKFVQRALGHRSIQNTMVYLDYDYNANEFKKLMRVR